MESDYVWVRRTIVELRELVEASLAQPWSPELARRLGITIHEIRLGLMADSACSSEVRVEILELLEWLRGQLREVRDFLNLSQEPEKALWCVQPSLEDDLDVN